MPKFEVILIFEFEEFPEGESCDAFRSYKDEIGELLKSMNFEDGNFWSGGYTLKEIKEVEEDEEYGSCLYPLDFGGTSWIIEVLSSKVIGLLY